MSGPRQPSRTIDEATWRRLRAALDDGVSSSAIVSRFGIGSGTVTAMRQCRTLEEAQEAMRCESKRRRAQRAGVG